MEQAASWLIRVGCLASPCPPFDDRTTILRPLTSPTNTPLVRFCLLGKRASHPRLINRNQPCSPSQINIQLNPLGSLPPCLVIPPSPPDRAPKTGDPVPLSGPQTGVLPAPCSLCLASIAGLSSKALPSSNLPYHSSQEARVTSDPSSCPFSAPATLNCDVLHLPL